jgi:hypothetical protein
MHIRYAVLVLSMLCGAANALAQGRECGTVISPAQIEAELRRPPLEKSALVALPPGQPYRIPLTIHICRMSDGKGGLSLGQLDSAMLQMNAFYSTSGIQFFQYGEVIFIDNTSFFSIPDNQAIRDMLRGQAVVANTVNVYFTNLDSLCGQGSFPTDPIQGVLMNNDCAGTASNLSSFAHELGHYLDLYHTHETAFGMECPDGGNCSTTGDRVCDTPADPDLTNRVTGCTYNGGVSPPAGCGNVVQYAPQVANMMSYAPKNCRNMFTSGQITRMLATMTGSRKNLHTLIKYVDRNWPGQEVGSPEQPFRTVLGALGASAPGQVIFANAGAYPENLTVTQQVQLRLWSNAGVVVIGQ